MPSDLSIYRVVVDQWEDYSEKSWKVWKNGIHAYWPKSKYEIGDMPNEFLCAYNDKWYSEKLIEAAERKRVA
jgi:hypothetical protein